MSTRPNKLTVFIQKADFSILPHLIVSLNGLLNTPPFIDDRYCKVSITYAWLLKGIATAIKRLIAAHSEFVLEDVCLDVICKFSEAEGYSAHATDGIRDISAEIKKSIPSWFELNLAFFWFIVDKELAQLKKSDEENLEHYWPVMLNTPFYDFTDECFDDLLKQTGQLSSLHRQIIALTLILARLKRSELAPERLVKLKQHTSMRKELSDYFHKIFNPTPDKVLQRKEAEWERKLNARKKEEENKLLQWITHTQANLPDIRSGTDRQSLYALHNYTAEKDASGSRWPIADWESLCEKFGREVAIAYREGVKRFWKSYTPKLRSEGASGESVPSEIILGLNGLQLEAESNITWLIDLGEEEIELACRYACHELNGFPSWFNLFFERYSKEICAILCKELQYDLATKATEGRELYVLHKIWSTEFIWDEMASRCSDMLQLTEPVNISSLESLLDIIQGSSLTDEILVSLIKSKNISSLPVTHASRWFAMWMGIAPHEAFPELSGCIESIPDSGTRTDFVMEFIVYLLGGRRSIRTNTRNAFHTPEYLTRLYLLMHEHIRVREDINRANQGVYSPVLRDDAQDARNHLAEMLRNIPGKATYEALLKISESHPEDHYKPWFKRMAKDRAELDGDIPAWTTRQVLDFHAKFENTPSDHKSLAELVHSRFLDLKYDLEDGDSSIAETLMRIEEEPEMRIFLGRELREKAFGRYCIPQEEELADGKKPDFRFHGMGFDAPIPAELKLADKWSGNALFERLENQLCGNYLRDKRSTHGLFILVNQGKNRKLWTVESKRVDFEELVVSLERHWLQISPKLPDIEHVEIVGIDLTKRG